MISECSAPSSECDVVIADVVSDTRVLRLIGRQGEGAREGVAQKGEGEGKGAQCGQGLAHLQAIHQRMRGGGAAAIQSALLGPVAERAAHLARSAQGCIEPDLTHLYHLTLKTMNDCVRTGPASVCLRHVEAPCPNRKPPNCVTAVLAERLFLISLSFALSVGQSSHC